eukprot:5438254-Amphidinium_carterae.1
MRHTGGLAHSCARSEDAAKRGQSALPHFGTCSENAWVGSEGIVVLLLSCHMDGREEPYAERWELLNHLYKISRCQTPAELVAHSHATITLTWPRLKIQDSGSFPLGLSL